MSAVTTTSAEQVQVRHNLLPPPIGDFRVPPAPPLVTSSTCSPPGGNIVMRPPPPPPPKIHRPEMKTERIHHEEPSSSIPDLGMMLFKCISILTLCYMHAVVLSL